MAQPETVEFALSGTVQGVEISPAHMPFGLMRKFHEDVERLVLGSTRVPFQTPLWRSARDPTP